MSLLYPFRIESDRGNGTADGVRLAGISNDRLVPAQDSYRKACNLLYSKFGTLERDAYISHQPFGSFPGVRRKDIPQAHAITRISRRSADLSW